MGGDSIGISRRTYQSVERSTRNISVCGGNEGAFVSGVLAETRGRGETAVYRHTVRHFKPYGHNCRRPPWKPYSAPVGRPGETGGVTEAQELGEAAEEFFPIIIDRTSYRDLLMDVAADGRIDNTENRGKAERLIKALQAALT